MKALRLLFVVLLLLGALATLAQEEEQEYISFTHGIAFSHPAGYAPAEMGGLVAVASDAALFASQDGIGPDGLGVILMNEQMILDFIDEIPSLEELVQQMSFFARAEVLEVTSTTVNGFEAARATLGGDRDEGAVVAVSTPDGIYLVVGISGQGGFADFEDVFDAIVASVRLGVTLEFDSLAVISAENAARVILLYSVDLDMDDPSIYGVGVYSDSPRFAVPVTDWGSQQTVVKVYDAVTGELLASSETIDDRVELAAVAGGFVLAAGRETLYVLDAETLELVRTMEITREDVFGSADLASIMAPDGLAIYDPAADAIVNQFPAGVMGLMMPDGGSVLLLNFEEGLQVELYDMESGSSSPAITLPDRVAGAGFNGDGTLFVYADDSEGFYQLTLMNLVTGEVLWTLDLSSLGDRGISGAVFSPDDSVMFFNQRELIFAVDVATGQIISTFDSGINAAVQTMFISPDGSYLVMTGYDLVHVFGIPE